MLWAEKMLSSLGLDIGRYNPLAYALSRPARAANVDLPRLAAELDGVFRHHGARTQAQPPSLLFHQARNPLASIASFVLEGDRIARAVVSHVRVAPFVAGIALVVHPKPELDAPLLVVDMMVTPLGRTRSYVDACGPSIARSDFDARFRRPLAEIADDARDMKQTTVPAWMAPYTGGCGGRLRAGRGDGELVARVVSRYVERYLSALSDAPAASDAAANARSARTVRDAVKANGPAGRYLRRAFGADFTDRYLRLLWLES